MRQADRPPSERRARMLGLPRNTKLGNLIHSFSIPALETCPGKSILCPRVCYALNGHFRQGNVKHRHRENLFRTGTAGFVAEMIAEIQASFVRVLRIHVAGDFYSEPYIVSWIEIAKACPKVQLFAYTRSWSVPELLPALLRLAALPNVKLWFSTDRSMEAPPEVPGVRVAFLATDAGDEKLAPVEADLVFREEHDTVRRHINGVQVCPFENGQGLPPYFTCSTCGICWRDYKTKHRAPRPEPAAPAA